MLWQSALPLPPPAQQPCPAAAHPAGAAATSRRELQDWGGGMTAAVGSYSGTWGSFGGITGMWLPFWCEPARGGLER